MHLIAELVNPAHTTRKQIRGSSLLLLGRVLSSGINFLAQLMLARYLSMSDYGALAYALAVVAMCQVFSTMGLQKAIPRFVPIYQEQREYGKLLGTILLAGGIILGLVLVLLVLVNTASGLIFDALVEDRQAVALLSIAVFLIPVQAADDLLVGLFAGLVRPRAIFFRKHVIAPGLKFAVVLALIALHANVTFVTYGYLVASAAGVLFYGFLLLHLLQRAELLRPQNLRSVSVPARELFSFSIPVLSAELVAGGVMSSAAIFLLAAYGDMSEVAFYRVAIPAAHLNMTVLQSFSILYTPLAARLFARGDYEGINYLYWSTTTWLAVLTFPIFVVTFSLAKPLTVFLYGARYEAADLILAVLALGFYFNAALGLNSQTLRVCGVVRRILWVNLLSAAMGIAAIWLLVPRYGALGAAIGTSSTLILRNVLTQAGLAKISGLKAFDPRHLPIYLLIAISASGLLLLQSLIHHQYLGLILAALAVGSVFIAAKRNLRVADTFPELLRFRIMRAIFA